MLSTLTSPASFPSVASPVIFTGSSYILSPNSTYWLVLRAPTGSFDWPWTEDITGASADFLAQWAASEMRGEAGHADSEPMQFRMLADAVTPAVPEPGSFALAGLSMAGVVTALRMRKKSMQ